MAIVANLAFPGNPIFPIDPPLNTPNRTNAGVPSGAPVFAGEIVLDTTGHNVYKALSTNANSWVPMSYNDEP